MKLETLKQTSRPFKAHWWTRRNRTVLAVITGLAVVVFVGVMLARHSVRRGWPQTKGTVSLQALRSPVTVVRDGNGVPHIFAENERDLYFAQGYVHAQDRFWEMELNRRRGRGILAELLGDGSLESDERWRGLDLTDAAESALAAMDIKERAPLDAYTAGVNAWLEADCLPFEFTLLGWRGHDVAEIDRWAAEDSLIVALVLSWQAGATWTDPSLAAQIEERVGPERGALLLGGEPQRLERVSDDLSPQVRGDGGNPLPRRWALSSQVTLVGGDQAKNNRPLLAVDLPTGLDLPVPWYVMSWRMPGEGAAGASAPGLPGLVVGTDDHAVWETWADPPQTAVLSLLKELVPSQQTLPWQRWLLAALLNAGKSHQLDGDQGPRTVAELRTTQQDTLSTRAARLIPLLVQVESEGWRQERVTRMLREWDYHIGDNNKESPFFVVYQLELARAAFADELGKDLFEAYVAQGDRYQAALDRILDSPGNAWWDDMTTPERELRDDIVKRAYEPALEWTGRNYGDLHVLWKWDIVHGSRLHHALGDAWPWDQLLSRDLNPDGWADTINASPGGLPCTGGICMGGDIFRAKAAYGYRQIADASDPSTLWFSLLPGQSGHPFHAHYDDLLDEWLAGKYLPLRLVASPGDVESAESVLILTPEHGDRD
jgi:acyl-homoserine lactone acylase PvdQ